MKILASIMYLFNAHKLLSQVKLKLGWLRSDWASDAHAQRIMGNGVITPPHDFKQLSRWYYRLNKIKKYAIEVITYGIKSIPNFMKILAGITLLLNAHKSISQVKFKLGSVRLG
jgi:hypothetical protein